MKKKFITMVVALFLIGALGVGATMAYLTDSTDTVTNTFTVGKVDIDLKENVDTQTGLTGFNYENVIPTLTYSKQPYVTVKGGSVDCYLFVEVENENGENLVINAADTEVIKTFDSFKAADGTTVYYKAVDGNVLDQVFTVFDSVTVGEDVTEKTTFSNIKITAYAIQKAGFEDDMQGAWKEVKKANTAKTE